MAQITVLDQSTINKIAAGEVIERPSSVVKELVENAIDAGANAITLEIKEGGSSLIRITDNGSGIPKEQIQLAFLRHSTSKIKSVEDLLTVSSLGFRGEALSSIAAVAQVELITKTAGALTGSRYLIDGGKEKCLEEIGAPEGTTFLVRNLFYNTPARRKFLKTAATEGGYISDLIEKLALSHPEISFRFINGGQNKLYTSGNGTLKDVIYGVYGREIVSNLLPVNYEGENFSVEGFIGKPVLNRGNRALENYFINGRYIKSTIISKAIEDAYSGFTMPKKYPFTALHFKIASETIDINVHPTKMELRFSDGERIYREVYQAVHDCLSRRSVIPEVTFAPEKREEKKAEEIRPPKEQAVQPSEAASVSAPESGVKRTAEKIKENKLPEPFEVNRFRETAMGKKPETVIFREEERNYRPQSGTAETIPKAPAAAKPEEERREPAPAAAPVQMNLFEADRKLLDEKSLADHKVIGQLFDTYWLIEFDQKLFIMDQHAAHEKVLYERFMKRAQEGSVASQQLLPPQIITLTLAAGQVLKENLPLIEQMGFEIESFGGNEYAIRGVPVELYGASGKDMVLEIIDDLMENPGKVSKETVKGRIATMACKAAVKGNNRLQVSEVQELIRELLTLENPYNCPHGRPTMISMSKYELEKKFKRIV